jgi:predicted AlkP superfamily pyrophosphatase or phosphodiesterase
MSGDARVDRILSWLDLPANQRPRFETLYFDIVDSAGHRHGPDAAETRASVTSVDASIGRLVEGLKARGLYDRTLLVLVSDHGMAATSPDRVVWIDDIIDPAALQIGYGGAVLTVDPAPGREAEVQQKLVGRHPHMECWNKADVPARLVYGSNPRVARIVCLVETGWLTATRDRPVTRPGGAHGYDNQAPEMQALFIAHGPGVIPGRRLTDLDSVDVQPFLARMLGVTAPQGDGRAEDTLPVTTQ